MADINSVSVTGRLTHPPEARQAGESQVVNFSIASNDWRGKRGEVANFFRCEAWGAQGQVIHDYCDKGSRVGISGKLQYDKWEKDGETKTSIIIRVDNVALLDTKGSNQQETATSSQPQEATDPF